MVDSKKLANAQLGKANAHAKSVDPEVLSYSSALSHYILGPRFTVATIPDTVQTYFPFHKDEPSLIPLKLTRSVKELPGSIRSWPTIPTNWVSWLDRMEAEKETELRDLGIWDILQFSRSSIPFNKPLLNAALYFWSVSTNSFHFNFGMMSPTLYDLAALFGLKPAGHKFSAMSQPKEDHSKLFSWSKSETSFSSFIRAHRQTDGPVSSKEFIAFLLTFICKFLLCSPAFKITKADLNLAVVLSQGRRLALGPYVLAHLYRSCREIVRSNFSTVAGPIWMLQIWLHAYFPELCPKFEARPDTSLYGFDYIRPLGPFFSHAAVFNFLYTTESRDSADFLPFWPIRRGPTWFTTCADLSVPYSDSDTYLVTSFWSSVLVCRDLHYRGTLEKSGNNRCGVEAYCPQYLARQFGLIQGLPAPPFHSFNRPLFDRITFTSLDEVGAVKRLSTSLRGFFQFRSFEPNPDVTSAFTSFWASFIKHRRPYDVFNVLDRNFVTSAPPDEDAEVSAGPDADAVSIASQESEGRPTVKTPGTHSLKIYKEILAFEQFYGIKYLYTNPFLTRREMFLAEIDVKNRRRDEFLAKNKFGRGRYLNWKRFHESHDKWMQKHRLPMPTAEIGIAHFLPPEEYPLMPSRPDLGVTWTGTYVSVGDTFSLSTHTIGSTSLGMTLSLAVFILN